jgi:cytochrome b561
MSTASTLSIATLLEILIAVGVAATAVWYASAKLFARRRAPPTRSDRDPRKTEVAKYHPAIVIIHWFIAFAMAQLLIRGAFIMVNIPNSDPAKIDALRAHMLAGIAVLTLMVSRLVLRQATALPPSASPGNRHLYRLKKIILPLLYLCVIVQALAGLGMAYQADLPDVLFGHHGALPESFWIYPLRSVHYAFSRLLMAVIAIHIAGAFYHVFFLKDGLLRRMSFGHRAASAAPRAMLEPHR